MVLKVAPRIVGLAIGGRRQDVLRLVTSCRGSVGVGAPAVLLHCTNRGYHEDLQKSRREMFAVLPCSKLLRGVQDAVPMLSVFFQDFQVSNVVGFDV
jgi:hypothetical protein